MTDFQMIVIEILERMALALESLSERFNFDE